MTNKNKQRPTKRKSASSAKARTPTKKSSLKSYRKGNSSALPDRGAIQHFLTQYDSPATIKEIARAFRVPPAEREALSGRLLRMVDDGQVRNEGRKGFSLQHSSEVLRGKVIGNSEGFGFVSVPDLGEDIYLPQEQMRYVLPGDSIAVLPETDRKNRMRGRVVAIQSMRTEPIVGTLRKRTKHWSIVPRDTRIRQRIVVEDGGLMGAREGDIVAARVSKHPFGRGHAIVIVEKIIGRPDEANIEIEIATLSYGIPNEFSEESREQADTTPTTVSASEADGRLDLRALPLVTIDGADARDFDDAVYCAPHEAGGWRLIVAIADVAHYVPMGSSLDEEAIRRGTSVYFPRNVIPMLPEALSNGICSLNPSEDRLCMACDMRVDAKGNVCSYQFSRAVMHSKARLTYSEVNAYYDGGTFEQPGEVTENINELKRLYEAFISQRQRRGALDLEIPEPKFIIGEDMRISGVTLRQRGLGERLIEECMLAANVCAAQFINEREKPQPYRVHESPDGERVQQLRLFLKTKALSLAGSEQPLPADYNEVLQSDKMSEDLLAIVQPMLLRSMKQARYTTEALGHYALQFEHYAHFTSPIRRYPDLIIHRQIAALINSQEVPYADGEALDRLATQCSDYERRAEEATRDVMKRLQAEYMLEHIGDVFEGVISGVASFGVFVFLSTMGIDGMVHVSMLPDDWYDFDAVRMALVGQNSGRKLAMGDHVRVQIVRVDVAEGKIDMQLAK